MTGQTYELNENHWRIPDDQGVHGRSKSDVEAVKRWKIATTFVFLVALVGFGVAVVALAELKNQKPPKPNDEPKTSFQIMTVNQSLLTQGNELEKVESSINELKQILNSQDTSSKTNTDRVNKTVINIQSRIQALGRSVLGTQNQLSSVEGSVNSLIKSVRRVSEGLRHDNTTARNRAKMIDATLARHGSELTKLQGALKNASNQLNSVKNTVSSLIGRSDSQSKNNTKLQGQINSLFDKQSNDVSTLKQTLTFLNQSLEQATQKLNNRLKTVNTSLSNTTYRLQKDANALKTKVAAAERNISKLQKDIGWVPVFNGYEYLVKRSGNNFNDSRKFCKSKGGDLAAVGLRSNDTRTHIAENFFASNTRYSIWIGLTDMFVEGEWYYVDQVKATKANTDFVPGEPNNYRGRQDCSYMHKFTNGYQMADYYCTSLFSALCERKIGY